MTLFQYIFLIDLRAIHVEHEDDGAGLDSSTVNIET